MALTSLFLGCHALLIVLLTFLDTDGHGTEMIFGGGGINFRL